MSTLFGLDIVPQPRAVRVTFEHRVERHPTKKRRRNWRVVKHRIEKPCAYQVGRTVYMHPDLIAKLRSATTQEPSA